MGWRELSKAEERTEACNHLCIIRLGDQIQFTKSFPYYHMEKLRPRERQ